ncbi:Gfo/Idh/MocA family protein [Planctomycetaceae bacterium SH139]
MAKFKIGVLGCGMIAELGHLPAITQCPDLELYALFDLDWQRTLDLQKRFGARHAFPTEEAFWKAGFDAVVICTPAPLHREHVLTAAEHGKHVLCEKPLAKSVADIEVMRDTMQAAGLLLATGFTYRFSHSAMEIRRLVREKAIGEVRALRLVYLWNLHGKWEWDDQGRMIPSKLRVGRMLEGGPMVDCGVHQIDLARWWLGSEVAWQHALGVWVEDFQAPDHVCLHMGHRCGAHSMIEMSFSYNATSQEPRSHFQYELIGTDGVLRYNREEHSFELRNSHGTQYLHWHGEKNFAGMYYEFAKALATGTLGDMPSANDALMATKISEEATRQAIRDRARFSSDCHSTMEKSVPQPAELTHVPLDASEHPETF